MTNAAKPNWDPNVTLKLRDEAPPITPHDHQLAAWDRLSAHFNDKAQRAGLVVVPTGGGKTMIAAHWLLEHHLRAGGRVLWLAHRRSLLRQAFQTFRRLGHLAFPKPHLHMIAISSTDAKWSAVSSEHDVVFSSMQSAVLEGNAGFVTEFANEATKGLFVVVDEAHHGPAPGYTRLLKKLKDPKTINARLIGLTATPVRSDDADEKLLASLFDENVIYQVTRRTLTERGILAVPAFETVKTQVNLEKDFTAADYKHLERFGELGPEVLARLARNAHRNGLIVDHYVTKKEQYGPTIVFAADVLHAATLAGEFKKKGIDADHVDYSRKDAQGVIDRFQTEKKPDVLVNVEMLTEGFDAPHTRTVFVARPTRSEGLLAQMVGRALRGKESGGNDKAFLVTFLDTWEQFDVLDAEYVLKNAEDIEKAATKAADAVRITIPEELIREAYRLLVSNVRGQFVGVYQCLPHGWYAWVELFEDDQQRRSVMVFDNQVEGYDALLREYATPESVPSDVTEDLARSLVQRFFGETPDPLPRWADVKALLDARRKGCDVHSYTFEEKKSFEPRTIAQTILDRNMTTKDEHAFLDETWQNNATCRFVYRDDFATLLEDVSRAKLALIGPPKIATPPEIEKIVPTAAPRAWPEGEGGYSLVALRDAVLETKRHFPAGAPLVGDLRWSKRPNPRLWGFFRYSDKSITLNCVLDSPDVPLFVVEFLMFHEMLHGDMPSAGHNADFRERERAFSPSAAAVEDAAKRGIKPGANASPDFWRVRADRFFDTFERYYAHKRPGTKMEI